MKRAFRWSCILALFALTPIQRSSLASDLTGSEIKSEVRPEVKSEEKTDLSTPPSSISSEDFEPNVELFSSLTELRFEDTPSILDSEKFVDGEFENGFNYTGYRPWRSPILAKNSDFEIPEAIRPVVQFWMDIYSKYSTSQGVLHDMDNPNLVFEVIDFTDIDQDENQSAIRKELNRKRRVEIRKREIRKLVYRLSRKKHFEGLSDLEEKIWSFFPPKDRVREIRKLGNISRVRFQLGQSDRMQTAIYYSGRYLEDFERIFQEQGLPWELTRLPFVESSFNIFAYSKVGASGIWQVMPGTSSQSYSSRSYYDLRNYPNHAAKMASKVLKIGYKLTDSWPLAVIGYNHGPSGVNRRVKQFHTRDIGLLLSKYKSGFGFASRNFYPCFLAVLNVESNASHFFKNIKWSEKLTSVPYKTPIPLKYREIVKWFDKDPERARVHNPHLTPLVRKANLTIPAGAPIEIPRVLAEEIDKELMFRAAQKHSTKKRKGNLARSLETPL